MANEKRKSEKEAVRRLSTSSWGVAAQQNEPFVTEWLWFWFGGQWHQHPNSRQIEEAYQANRGTFEFYVNEMGCHYELRFNGTSMHRRLLV